jgi:hypothetical protein
MQTSPVEVFVQPIAPQTHARVWNADPQLRAKLESAGWRYAALIGIVEPGEIGCSPSTCARDRKKYGHLVHKWAGWPLWDDEEAATFVAEITGASREMSAAWLEFDWNSGAKC